MANCVSAPGMSRHEQQLLARLVTTNAPRTSAAMPGFQTLEYTHVTIYIQVQIVLVKHKGKTFISPGNCLVYTQKANMGTVPQPATCKTSHRQLIKYMY